MYLLHLQFNVLSLLVQALNTPANSTNATAAIATTATIATSTAFHSTTVLPVLRNIFLWPCPFIYLLLLGLIDHYSLQDVLTALYVSYLTTPYSVSGEFT